MASCLILMGFMGSGKSVVGSNAARNLGWDFADADQLAEKAMGMTISEAFASRGEEYFRRTEETIVLDLLDQPAVAGTGMVLSIGGGAVTISRVHERLALEPLVVLLDQDIEVCLRRAQNGRRPLAADPERFRKLHAARQVIYRELARFTVDTRGKSVQHVADDVIRIARERT